MQTIERPSRNGHFATEQVRVEPAAPKRRPWRAIVAVVVAIALIVTGALVYTSRSAAAVTYTTTPVVQQDLVQSVSSTGTVNPQNTINVGTQVSGLVSEIDADYNSRVKKGQVLARLDPTSLQAQLDSARAALAQSQAQAAAAQNTAAGSVANIGTVSLAAQAAAASTQAAQATALASQQAIAGADSGITKAQGALGVAQQTVNRDKSLLAQGYIAQSQYDTDNANLIAAQSAVSAAQVAAQQARSQAVASVAQARSSVAQTASQSASIAAARDAAAGSSQSAAASSAGIGIQEAAVQQAQTNLSHTVITSPVDGTVIARDVSVGTTVAASLQTPTLFAIAQDLSKMEVDLAVGEPDIGSVRAGEGVDFTVLAFPSRVFHGVVSQVRKNPVTTSNVVTYTTVVLVNNADQALLPGMTANATIGVQKAGNALVVPLAALAYHPAAATGTHRTRPAGAAGGTGVTAASGSPWGQTMGSSTATIAAGSQARLFVLRDGKPVAVRVNVVLVSGTQAAVTPAQGAALTTADAAVIGEGSAGSTKPSRSASSANTNPLAGGSGAGGALRGIR